MLVIVNCFALEQITLATLQNVKMCFITGLFQCHLSEQIHYPRHKLNWHTALLIMEDIPYSVVRILHEDSIRQFCTIPVVFFLLDNISNSSQDSSSKMHQKAPQSTHKIQNFLGIMPPDPPRDGGPKGPPGALVSINF